MLVMVVAEPLQKLHTTQPLRMWGETFHQKDMEVAHLSIFCFWIQLTGIETLRSYCHYINIRTCMVLYCVLTDTHLDKVNYIQTTNYVVLNASFHSPTTDSVHHHSHAQQPPLSNNYLSNNYYPVKPAFPKIKLCCYLPTQQPPPIISKSPPTSTKPLLISTKPSPQTTP